MNNPLDNVPLNTRKSYVMGKTWNGCEVYVPVDSDNDAVLKSKKNSLQKYLNSLTPPPDPKVYA